MDVKIVPAVLPASREDLERQLRQLAGVADTVQVNVVDGKFASPASWPYLLASNDLSHMVVERRMLPSWGHFRFEVDILAHDAEETAGHWIALGASRLTIHIESVKNIEQLLQHMEVHYGHDKDFAPDLLSIGLALELESDPSRIEPFIDRIDYVQFAGVSRIGKQGEPFDARVVDRIKEFRKAHPSIPVQIDGGVSRMTAPALLQAGVTNLIVGKDLWDAPDRKERYEELSALIEQYGIYE